MKEEILINLLLALINQAGPVSDAIRAAHMQGRTLNREELQTAFSSDDTSRALLVATLTELGE